MKPFWNFTFISFPFSFIHGRNTSTSIQVFSLDPYKKYLRGILHIYIVRSLSVNPLGLIPIQKNTSLLNIIQPRGEKVEHYNNEEVEALIIRLRFH